MSHPSSDQAKVNRSIAWIGFASTLVGLLDIAALFIIFGAGWVSRSEYGIATLAVTLFPILDLATDMGLSSAVIQRDDHTEEKISTVFWLNFLMSLVLFAALCGIGPVLARLQGHTIVGVMLITYGSKLIFQNLYQIPHAMMKRELRFKELSIIRIIANVAEFAGKVGFAAAGFQIWCFVLGPMCRVVITGIGVQMRHPWRPKAYFRLKEAADYASYGIKTSGSQILFHFYTNIDYQIVGKFFGDDALGLYRFAYELVLEPVRIISNVVSEVAFPLFSRLRGKRAQLVEQFIQFTRQNLVVVIPYLSVILLAADEFIEVCFPERWTPAAQAARVLCIVGVFRALSFVVPPLLDGIGYPGTTLTYTAVAAVVLPGLYILCAFLLGPSIGYLSVAVAWAIGYPIAFSVLAFLALHRIGLHGFEYLRRVIGIPACAAVGIALGGLVRLCTPSLHAAPRFAAIAITTLGSMGLLLARYQGISPRSISRAIKGSGPPPNDPPHEV